MSSLRIAVLVAVVLVALVDWSTALPAADKERLLNEVDVSNKTLPPCPFQLNDPPEEFNGGTRLIDGNTAINCTR